MCQASNSEIERNHFRMDDGNPLARLGQDEYLLGDVSVVEKSSCDKE
jgi:hypothetical protein